MVGTEAGRGAGGLAGAVDGGGGGGGKPLPLVLFGFLAVIGEDAVLEAGLGAGGGAPGPLGPVFLNFTPISCDGLNPTQTTRITLVMDMATIVANHSAPKYVHTCVLWRRRLGLLWFPILRGEILPPILLDSTRWRWGRRRRWGTTSCRRRRWGTTSCRGRGWRTTSCRGRRWRTTTCWRQRRRGTFRRRWSRHLCYRWGRSHWHLIGSYHGCSYRWRWGWLHGRWRRGWT